MAKKTRTRRVRRPSVRRPAPQPAPEPTPPRRKLKEGVADFLDNVERNPEKFVASLEKAASKGKDLLQEVKKDPQAAKAAAVSLGARFLKWVADE